MDQPIRILMVFTIMNRGGAETMVMNYYRHIDRSKVQFDFMVHREERGAYDDEIEALGGRIFRMMPLHPLTFGKYKKQISRFFDEHQHEYRIIHGHCSESAYFVYKEAARRGVPVIIAHAHNSHALFDLKWFFRTWFKVAMRRFITQGFTCSADAARWLFGERLAKAALLQRNAIDTEHYKYDPATSMRKRQELGIAADTLVIGHVGRFNKQKNHEFLLDVFSEIKRKHADACLLLIGTGESQSQMKGKAKRLGLADNVRFLGTRADVSQLLQAMDVFLFPSFMEGLPVSMVEAQCAGLPCVASDTIPKEVAMTDLVTFVSLKRAPEEWAETVLDECSKRRDRSAYPEKIAKVGYDIVRNAQWLQDYYLEQWDRAKKERP